MKFWSLSLTLEGLRTRPWLHESVILHFFFVFRITTSVCSWYGSKPILCQCLVFCWTLSFAV